MLRPCRHVHTVGMRFPIDVAFCDAEGTVLRTATLAPWRVSPVVRRAAFVIEAEAGAFERWRLTVGRPAGAANVSERQRDGYPGPPRANHRVVTTGRWCSSRPRSATSATCRRERSRRCATPT